MTNALLQPVGSLDAYFLSIKQIPVLTETEEKTLADRWYYSQDIDAARQLVMAHLRYVVSVAKRYKGYGLQLADLIQEGNIGLMKAVKKFNPTLGVRLVAFAVYWIKAEIHEFILRNWRIVKIATTKAQRKLFFKLKSFKQKFGENMGLIAKEMGIKKNIVDKMNARLSYTDAHIEEAYPIADPHADPAKLLEQQNMAVHKEQLLTALQTLDERSRDILNQRWLNTDETKSTLQALALHYNVSAERIRQLEKNAIAKLKLSFADR